MNREKNVSEFFDRVILLKSRARPALEDEYQNVEKLLPSLDDCSLDACKRGSPQSISSLIEIRNP